MIECLPAEQATEKVTNAKIIYIDPPFYTQERFADFNDTWSSIDEYLGFLRIILQKIRNCLREDGVLCIHCDYHASHYIKVMCDTIFGYKNFANEFYTMRSAKNGKNQSQSLFANVDSILVYYKDITKGKIEIVPQKPKDHENRWCGLTAGGDGGPKYFFGQLIKPPKGRHFMWSQETIDRKIAEGRVRLNANNTPTYLPDSDSLPCGTLWDDIPAYATTWSYSTEKSTSLLERLILMYTKEGDLVVDFFCGSGVTGEVAKRFKRQFYLSDKNPKAIEISKKRVENDA
jgi:adenine-specific DNA-methyltransferase